jgi:hypothetical protein
MGCFKGFSMSPTRRFELFPQYHPIELSRIIHSTMNKEYQPIDHRPSQNQKKVKKQEYKATDFIRVCAPF